MMVSEFFHIYSTGMNPCTLEKRAYAEAYNTWLCVGCGAPRPGTGSINVLLQEKEPADSPITFVNGCGVIIVRKDFLFILGSDRIENDLLLGNVVGAGGALLPEWVTARGRKRLVIRGDKNVSYRECDACGRHVYFAMGSRYLYPEPSTEFSIFESDLYGFIVPVRVFNDSITEHWPDLEIERLPALPESKDSLGDLNS